MSEWDINAADWLLISTRGSKYAHAPNWSPQYQGTRGPVCGASLANDPYSVDNKLAEGKPPCPRCIRMLRHHLGWLEAWTDSYENLDWKPRDAMPDGET